MDIRFELLKRGTNLQKVAIKNNLSINACHVAMRKKCPAAEQAICKELGLPLEKVFPDRYKKSRRAA